ncbi:GYD domain-containing protein [Calditrichota bacterium]
MSTYVMYGKYSMDAIKTMSAGRTDKGRDLVKKFGGEVKSMYALLGEKDLLFIAAFPDAQNAMKASVALSKLTGISFTTTEAIPVEQFDKIMTEV